MIAYARNWVFAVAITVAIGVQLYVEAAKAAYRRATDADE